VLESWREGCGSGRERRREAGELGGGRERESLERAWRGRERERERAGRELGES